MLTSIKDCKITENLYFFFYVTLVLYLGDNFVQKSSISKTKPD